MAFNRSWSPLQAITARLRSFRRSVLSHDQTEADIREEFEHHVDMRTAHLVREGLSNEKAEKQARVEFGHMHSLRDDARVARGLRRFDQLRISWIDVKLGLRMLVKHPVLSFASVFALAVGIPIGLAPSHIADALNAPLPGDADNRVRAIRYWDPAAVGVAATRYHDFDVWSRSLKSFTSLGAFRNVTLNVAAQNERPEPVSGAQMSGVTFALLGIAPRMGRALSQQDAERGSPNVAVIGDQLWRSRFNADSAIVGRTIRVGGTMTTIVGVMPEGFRFPSNEQLWIPLRKQFAGGVESGPSVQIIGRLMDDVTDEQAQTELASVLIEMNGDAAELEQFRRLRAEVVPFGLLYLGLPRGGLAAQPEFRLVQILMYALLLVACGNVAMLIFARTATRLREIAIRTSLGASRSRIISQLFVETFIASAVSAVLGVLMVNWLLRNVNLAAIAGQTAMPYWLTLDITRSTVMNAVFLATACATVAGIVPAFRITGRAVNQNIRAYSAVRFGKLTSGLIVADIAVAVIAVGLSLTIVRQMLDLRQRQTAGIPASEFAAAEFRLSDHVATDSEQDRAEQVAHRATVQRALVAALAAEPGIRSVAVGDVLPLMEHRSQPFVVDGPAQSSEVTTKWVRTATVDVDYFRALGQSVVAGRDFSRTDAENVNGTIIVNTAFVERVFGGRDAIGQRVRFPSGRQTNSTPSRSYEIVGVVRHLGVNMVNVEHGEAVYFPVAEGQLNPMQVALHVGASPLSIMPRVREIAAAVDPDLVVSKPVVLGDLRQSDWYLTLGVGIGLTVLAAVLVALATSGLFAMLSLSVTERTREIGIRAALGATRRMLVLAVLRRSLVQIGTGAAIGLPIALFVNVSVAIESHNSALGAFLMAGALSVGIVGTVGVLSCLVPTRRVLAVQATEAMRAEA